MTDAIFCVSWAVCTYLMHITVPERIILGKLDRTKYIVTAQNAEPTHTVVVFTRPMYLDECWKKLFTIRRCTGSRRRHSSCFSLESTTHGRCTSTKWEKEHKSRYGFAYLTLKHSYMYWHSAKKNTTKFPWLQFWLVFFFSFCQFFSLKKPAPWSGIQAQSLTRRWQ